MTDLSHITPAAVATELRNCTWRYGSERVLQETIAERLSAAGFPVHREVPIGRGSRIDLLVGDVGVEVKVASTSANVLRQIRRYLNGTYLTGLVLVTDNPRHLQILQAVNGKPVEVVSLAESGL